MSLTDYQASDQPALRQLALDAFEQYKDKYQPWEEFQAKVAGWTSLSQSAQLIIAKEGGVAIGAVAFVPPFSTPKGHFPPDWAAIRMLVVHPAHRGKGVGKKLTQECINRAQAAGCATIGLHTSPVMEVALGMYLKMGFTWDADIAPISGVPYAVYRLELPKT